MSTHALVNIDPTSTPAVWIGGIGASVRNDRGAVSVIGWNANLLAPMKATMRPGATCSGINNDTGEPFRIDLGPAVLEAAKRQGVLVLTGHGPLIHKGGRP